MPAKNKTQSEAKAKDSGVDEQQAKTRLLLALWDMGGGNGGVKKGELTDRVKRKSEKSGDYRQVFEQLEEAEAIAIETQKRVAHVSLKDKGLEILSSGLKSPDFQYEAAVGAKTVNALLRWFREKGIPSDGAQSATASGKTSKGAIASYDKFKHVALDVYDRLNRDYNLDDLVPIYRIRREIGDRVSRSQFNEWLLEMQADDIFQLLEGSVEDSAPDKIEDSITTKVNGLRCYAKRVIS
jgi:hypothetical protein